MHKKSFKIIREFLIIVTVIFAFMTSACFYKKNVMNEHLIAYYITFIADVVILIGWIWIGCNTWIRLKKRYGNLEIILEENCGVVITLFFCIGTRITQFDDIPRWDAWVYYRVLTKACESFDFTFRTFWQNFSMANHPTLAFAGITAVGEFLNIGGYTGVLIVWLAVTLVAAFCVYRILEKILPFRNWIYHTLGTCVIMSTPNVLGTFSYYQPDMGLAIFFVFTIYCYLYKRNLLLFFSMSMLLLTKEPGIVILGGFGLGALIGRVAFTGKEKSAGRRFLQFFREPLGVSALMAGAVLILYFIIFLSNGGSIWQYGGSSFRFEPAFILYKCKQYFVLNFNWLIWGANLILYIQRGIVRKSKKRVPKGFYHKDIVLSILCAALAQMLFFSCYVTFTNPRYQMAIDFCGVFLFVIQLGGYRPRRKKWAGNKRCTTYERYAIISVAGILLLLESYLTVDPVSLLVFNNNLTGSGYIITEGYNGGIIQGDYTVYNHQHNYLTRVYNHILRSVGYHEGMDIILWNNPGSYGLLDEEYCWDIEKKELVLMAGEDTIFIRGYIQDEMYKDIEFQDEAVFILLPQFNISEDSAERFLSKYYETRYKGTVKIWGGGKATFYVCDLAETGRMME